MPFNRRQFIKRSLAASAAVSLPTIVRPSVLRGADRKAPSDKINLGVIGIGFFWWGLCFLVGGRVTYLAAMPGAAATMVCLGGLRVFSGLVFEPLIVIPWPGASLVSSMKSGSLCRLANM